MIEILIVIIIIAIVSGVVAPVAYKSVEKFETIVKKARIAQLEKKANFMSFITDQTCRLDNSTIVCGSRRHETQ